MSLEVIVLLVLKLSIMLNVFAVGLSATPSDATYMLEHPQDLGRVFLSMNVVMPVVALVLISVFPLPPAVKIALVVLSVSPIPPIFPRRALKAGARLDYVVGLIAAAAALSIVVIPVSLEVIQGATGFPLHTPMKSVITLVLMTVLIPLLVAIGVRAAAAPVAERIVKPVSILAAVLLVLSLLPVLPRLVRGIPELIGNGTLLSMAIFAFVGFIVGNALGGNVPENQYTLALATSSRHPAIAFALARANFPDQALTLPAIVLYLLLSAVCGIVYGRLQHRGTAAVASKAARAPTNGTHH
jgi:BASS family bile acid:Na+ symporter